ncbi:MAG: hypothetical protein FIA93_01460 [Deltaproteobacteria bacterium]|nr:hypothetical protein [Deltaproteobacteria bacterium]
MKNVRESSVVFVLALFALVLLPQLVLAASPAAGQAPGPAKMEAKSGCPCDCDCAGCGKECMCGHMHGGHGKPHGMMGGMEGMKNHMEEVRKSVTALRDHEKKMEGITDPAEFRKAAMEHFRMLDDLHESHVKHMESMMGGMGNEPMRHGHDHQGK